MTQRLRIAVADDERLIRRWLSEIVPEMGHDLVAVAEDGRDLVEQCARLRPDLVVTDIRMPALDGIDAALAICEQHPVPVILLSAFHDADLIERAAATDIMAYLVKPVEKAQLQAAISVAWRRFGQIASLRDDVGTLRQSLADRRVIERAKGLLMDGAGISEAEAHRRLQRTASKRNLRLVVLAQKLIEAGDILELLDEGQAP